MLESKQKANVLYLTSTIKNFILDYVVHTQI